MNIEKLYWKRTLAALLSGALLFGDFGIMPAKAVETVRQDAVEKTAEPVTYNAVSESSTEDWTMINAEIKGISLYMSTALSKLQTTLDGLTQYEAEDYTWASWQNFETSRGLAEAVMARENDGSLTLQEVKRTQNLLEAAVNALQVDWPVVLGGLREILLSLDQFKQEDYTQASWFRLTVARKKAGEVLAKDSPKLEEVKEAGSELKAAIGSLVTNLQDARQNLYKRLQEAKSLDSRKYTADTWKKFQTAVTNATNVYNSKEAGLAMVNSAAAALNLAKASLKTQAASDSQAAAQAAAKALKDTRAAVGKMLNAEAAAYKKGQRLYTDASWRAYASAYVKLSKSKSSSPKTLNDLRNALSSAKKKLKKANITTASIRDVKRISYKKASISIKKVTGAKCYLVYRSEKKSSGYRFVQAVTKTSYVDAKIAAGKTYYYKAMPVKSYKSKKYQPFASGYSNKVSAGDLNGSVAKKGSAKKISLHKIHSLQMKKESGKLKLSWGVPEGVRYTMIQFRKDGTKDWKLAGKQSRKYKSGKVVVPPSKYWFRTVYIWSDGTKTATGQKAFG